MRTYLLLFLLILSFLLVYLSGRIGATRRTSRILLILGIISMGIVLLICLVSLITFQGTNFD